jgi:hypothetical protein
MSTDEKHKKKVADKYKVKLAEYKENNKKMLCVVNLSSLVCTVLLFLGTVVILNLETACTTSYLKLALILMLGMHATNIVESVC